MGSNDGGHDGPHEADQVEFGSPSPRRPWVAGVVVGALVLGLGVLVGVSVLDDGGGQSQASPSASPSATGSPTPDPDDTSSDHQDTPSEHPSSSPTRPPVTKASVDVSGLDAGGDWEIVLQTSDSLVRLRPAAGQKVTTRLPQFSGDDAPVSLVAGPDRILLHSWDGGGSYLVPDGEPPRTAPAELTHTGGLVPGPEPGTVWVTGGSDGQQVRIDLVGLDGHDTGQQLTLPASTGPWGWNLRSDGSGYLYVRLTGGVYALDAAGLHRVTRGAVVAVGATRWLVVECDERHHCHNVVIDKDSRARQRLPGGHVYVNRLYGQASWVGTISPDGDTAALVRRGPESVLRLVHLDSGRTRDVALTFDPGTPFVGGLQTQAWSPDGRWLFVVTADGHVAAVDAETGEAHRLEVGVDTAQRVTVRTGSG